MASVRFRLIVKTALATTLLLGAGAALGGWLVVENGWYSVAATKQHFQVVHSLLEKALKESVRFHARDIAEPSLPETRVPRGAGLYRRNCEQCHGGPGVAPQPMGRSLQPVPGPLVDAARRWHPREMYWITRHGIKMSGMPAWEYRMTDDELWDLVAFLQRLPMQTTASYQAIMARADSSVAPPTPPGAMPDGENGRIALAQHACTSCHMIDGVTGPDTNVGPLLKGLAQRKYIAGRLPNTPDNLARWIMDPQAVHPQTTMPNLQVSERSARDMAAYLLSR